MKKKRRETNVPQVERNFRFSGIERRQTSVAVLLKFWLGQNTLTDARSMGVLHIPGVKEGTCSHPVRLAYSSLEPKYPNFRKLIGYIVRYDLDRYGPYIVCRKRMHMGNHHTLCPSIKPTEHSKRYAYVCFLPDEWVGKRVRRTITHHVLDTGEQVRVA